MFLTALISDKDMEDQFKATTKLFNPAYHNKQVETALNDEYKQLLVDRQTYRNIYMWSENNNLGHYLIDNIQQMPINPFRIIEDVIYNYEDVVENLAKSEKILDPIKTIESVNKLCNTIA